MLGSAAQVSGDLKPRLLCLAAQVLAFLPWAAKNTAMTGNPVFPLANTLFRAYPPGWGPAQSDHFDATHAPGPDERGLSRRLLSFWRHVPAPGAMALCVAGLCLAYLWMPLLHHVGYTDGYAYITDSDNFFARDGLLQVAIWLVVAVAVWGLTRLRRYLAIRCASLQTDVA